MVNDRHKPRVGDHTLIDKETEQAITFQNGIIQGFQPKYKSVQKDCDRYSDELCTLIETKVIETHEYIQLSGTGSLWIAFQYIENGFLDLVEAHVISHVTSRDFYGPLFENTRSILDRLVDCSEHDRVFTLYHAAITHRLKALTAEAAIRNKSQPNSQSWNASAKWVKTHLPTLKKMIKDYEVLLAKTHQRDPNVEVFNQSVQEISAA